MSEDKSRAKAVEAFAQYIAARQLRDTPERRMILDTIFDINGHFTIEDLSEKLDRSDFRVARSTVYATMELMVDCGIVRSHHLRGGAVQYERRVGTGQHFHCICTRCGRIRQIREPEIARMLNYRRYPSFTVTDIEVYVYGLCHKCRKAGTETRSLPARK